MFRALSSPRVTRFFFDRGGLFYGWLTSNPLWRDSLREMARHLPPSAAELKVLDAGCGPGKSARQLLDLRPDLRITGLDFSAGMLRLARKLTSPPAPLQLARGANTALTPSLLAERGPEGEVNFAQADVTRLPVADDSFDAITAHSVYYMLADQAAFLREAMRVLRPGGRLILLDPALRPYPFDALKRIRQPRAALSVLVWHAVAGLHRRATLEQMAARLSEAGFARVLAERAVEGYGVLSRGEKPYPNLSTVERIAQIAAIDGAGGDWQVIDSAVLPTVGRGRYVFLLVRQTPDKPPWAFQPGEAIRWDAVMVSDASNEASDTADHGHPYLLAFTSLPKAVAFMQPAVTSGALKGVNKVAKFDKAAAPRWATDVLLNPAFDGLRESGRYVFAGLWLAVDPAGAVAGEE